MAHAAATQEAHPVLSNGMASGSSLTARMEAFNNQFTDGIRAASNQWADLYQRSLATSREIDEVRNQEDESFFEATRVALGPLAAFLQPTALQGPAGHQPSLAPAASEAPVASPSPSQPGSRANAKRRASRKRLRRTTGTSSSDTKPMQKRWYHARPDDHINMSSIRRDEYIVSYNSKHFMVIRCPGRDGNCPCKHYYSEHPFEAGCAITHFKQAPHHKKMSNYDIAQKYGLKVLGAREEAVKHHNLHISSHDIAPPTSQGEQTTQQLVPEADMGLEGTAGRVQSDIRTTSSGASTSDALLDALVERIKQAPDSPKPSDSDGPQPQPTEPSSGCLDMIQDVVYISSGSSASSWTESRMGDSDDGHADVYDGPASDWE